LSDQPTVPPREEGHPDENSPEKIILNNRYRLEERRGAGGMAMVYRATDLMLERTVAIKLLRADFSSDPVFRERFRQEAKASANLSHPNIVTVHDFSLDSGRLYIVMEFVPGTDLKTIIQERGRLNMSEAIDLMVQACAGIGYAHRAGLVHCDVKPQNMLVTPDKRLKVVDFGIARALASISPDEKPDVVWGSPQYFSPEQAAGEPPSPASDVYSLGVVFFEMLTSQLPFGASSPEELARLHRDVPPPSPSRFNPEIPPQLEQILLKVLSKEPSARYRTADQFGRVLVTFTQQSASIDPSPTPPYGNKAPAQPETHIAETEPWHGQPVPQRAAPPLPPLRRPPAPVQTYPANEVEPHPIRSAAANPLDIDWITWILGLLALIAVGGLIPFCLWVYYTLNPPF
jgi:serine/threonine protein kinase